MRTRPWREPLAAQARGVLVAHLLLTLPCACDSKDPASHSGLPDDSAPECPGESRWFCDADWYHAFSVPADRGWEWEIDPDFLISGASVPNPVVLHEGAGYLMLLTQGSQWGVRYVARSSDGIDWTIDKEPLIPEAFFGLECNYFSTDSSEIYLDDGSYRLIVEGLSQEDGSYTHCSARSEDGERWEPEHEVYEIPKQDNGTSSVWSTLRSPTDGAWYNWYNGDLLADNDVRVARSTDGLTFSPYSRAGVIPKDLVDPDTVIVEEGGYRVFLMDGVYRELRVVEGPDELSFGDSSPLSGFDLNGCTGGCPSVCRYDPAYLRLPDDSIYLYFGEFSVDENCKNDRAGIRRARALD